MKAAQTVNPLPGIRAKYNRIIDRLHREAKADRCKGDICTGWDWPTLRIVKPDVYAELHRLNDAHKAEWRSLMSAGLHPSQTR